MNFLKNAALTIVSWTLLLCFGGYILSFFILMAVSTGKIVLNYISPKTTQVQNSSITSQESLEFVLPPKQFRSLISDSDAERSNPLARVCNSDVHPSKCHEKINDRIVRIDMYDGAGSGTVYQANGKYAIIVTARHVIELSHQRIESHIKQIKTAYGHILEPLVTCISPIELTNRAQMRVGTDLAIIIARADGYAEPRLGYSAGTSGSTTIGEFAGDTPNTQSALAQMHGKAEIQTIPSLWTGSSGSGIFDLSGRLVGVYVAGSKFDSGLEVGIGVAIPKLNSRFFRSMMNEYECFNQATNEPLAKNDFMRYYANSYENR